MRAMVISMREGSADDCAQVVDDVPVEHFVVDALAAISPNDRETAICFLGNAEISGHGFLLGGVGFGPAHVYTLRHRHGPVKGERKKSFVRRALSWPPPSDGQRQERRRQVTVLSGNAI